MSEKKIDNMTLWDAVAESDTKSLKQVGKRGGFTAISAQYQIKKATELWGPYGASWGLFECQFSMIQDANGNNTEMTLDAVFTYPGFAAPVTFPISCDMPYVPGNETRKKLMTDATTKALSKLGFNADVFMDLLAWDGNKYVKKVEPIDKLHTLMEESNVTDEQVNAALIAGKRMREGQTYSELPDATLLNITNPNVWPRLVAFIEKGEE